MTKRIAVIAVHGVGHHTPREAARACADMLGNTGRYSPFVESPLRIPVKPIGVPASVSPPGPRRSASWVSRFLEVFDERPLFVRGCTERSVPADVEYMTEQLRRYQPEGGDCIYETVSLKAVRTEGEREVHVYDMFWTDLSRVSTAGLRMIGELYQLLFYVSGLGRHTLDFASETGKDDDLWGPLALFHRYAERLLVLWIPVLNLCAAGLAIVLLPRFLISQHISPYAMIAGLLSLYTTALLAFVRWRKPGRSWPLLLPEAMLVILVAVGAATWASLGLSPASLAVDSMVFDSEVSRISFTVLIVLSWIIAAVPIVWLMALYGKRRPGAYEVALVCVTVVGVFLAQVAGFGLVAKGDYATVGVVTGRVLYFALHTMWSLFTIAAMLVTAFGCIVWHRNPDSASHRTAWTANLSLVLPGLLVIALNLGLWQGMVRLAEKYSIFDPETAWAAEQLIRESTLWVLGLVMSLGIAVIVSTAWGVLPSVLTEVRPKVLPNGPDDREAFSRSLSMAFKVMRVGGEILRYSLVLVMPLTYVLTHWVHVFPASLTKPLVEFSEDMTLWAGLALLFILFGPIRELGMGLRTAIDVAIDVANWLRLYPLNQNPRAMICARFTSLLENIVEYRDEKGAPFFQGVAFFCHSQGTVIVSETLRYLQVTGNPLSGKLAALGPVLFTMGCPLRQLYSQRFPIQYGWARNENKTFTRPDPADLNVAGWVNAYRSGDYVGRELWCDESNGLAFQPLPSTVAPGVPKMEGSIGPGGHTHYWDDSAPAIGWMLDSIVLL